MKQYTVLLKRPDYVSDIDTDTYLAWVKADNVPLAQAAAQLEAWTADDCPDENDCCDDYIVLAVFVGHLNDLKEQG